MEKTDSLDQKLGMLQGCLNKGNAGLDQKEEQIKEFKKHNEVPQAVRDNTEKKLMGLLRRTEQKVNGPLEHFFKHPP